MSSYCLRGATLVLNIDTALQRVYGPAQGQVKFQNRAALREVNDGHSLSQRTRVRQDSAIIRQKKRKGHRARQEHIQALGNSRRIDSFFITSYCAERAAGNRRRS